MTWEHRLFLALSLAFLSFGIADYLTFRLIVPSSQSRLWVFEIVCATVCLCLFVNIPSKDL